MAKITYSQNYSGRDIWSEEHTCLDHANDLFERIKRGAILLETKWLNK